MVRIMILNTHYKKKFDDDDQMIPKDFDFDLQVQIKPKGTYEKRKKSFDNQMISNDYGDQNK
ncbi:hypothetical protein DERF_010777 [Dermatophagoides farinae]|uniref:Uncharacterized protein n=1 Tax=Dermatophagoides farinae TaxID=6954 RepID=A0A922HTN4_DERFA|nr:hypothetical protein DERF_010777 [Dermatophagoides farinae]